MNQESELKLTGLEVRRIFVAVAKGLMGGYLPWVQTFALAYLCVPEDEAEMLEASGREIIEHYQMQQRYAALESQAAGPQGKRVQ